MDALHVSAPSCKPQHDLETFRSSYRNLTDAVGPDLCNLNTVNSNAVQDGIVGSVENVVRDQLPSAWFSANNSSVSGGVVCDAFPIPATALTPLTACSHSQVLNNRNDITATAVGVSEQPEKINFSMSPHTAGVDHGQLLALAPTRIQAGAKPLARTTSQAFDVYEFCDEDDSELPDVSISFRKRKLSKSAALANSVSSQLSSCVPVQSGYQRTGIFDSTKKCHSASETDAGVMSASQNVAMIFDMDSKSIRHVSLPVKTEPRSLYASSADSVPSMEINNASLHVKQSTGCVSVGERKLSLPSNDANCKRLRLHSNTSGYLASGNVGTNKHLPNICDLISSVKKTSECGGSMMTFDRWPQKSFMSSPVSFTAQSLSSTFGSVTYPDHKPPDFPSIKLLDVSAQSHVVNVTCSEVVKCESVLSNSVPKCQQFLVTTQSAGNPWLFNRNAAANNTYSSRSGKPVPVSGQSVYPTYAGLEYRRYGIHQPKSISTSQQAGGHWEDKNNYESGVDWWRMAVTKHPSAAVHSNYVGQNTFRNVSFKEVKTGHENLQHDSLSYVLDLSCNNSQMSPSTSGVNHGHDFRPNLPPTAAASSQVRPTIADSPSPHLHLNRQSYHHRQLQQQQQQLALTVKKEDLEEMTMKMTDEEKLMNRLKCNLLEEVPHCQCRSQLHTSLILPSCFICLLIVV